MQKRSRESSLAQWQINRGVTTAKIVGTTQAVAAVAVIAAEEDEEVEAAVAAVAGVDTRGDPPTTEAVAAPHTEGVTETDLEAIEEGVERLIVGVAVAVAAVADVGAGEGPPSQGIGSPPTRRSKIPRTSCSRVCRK